MIMAHKNIFFLLQSTTIQRKLERCSEKIVLMVRASLEDAAAYLFDYSSRANRSFGDFKRTAVSQKEKEKGKFELLVSRAVILEGIYWNSQQECMFSSVMELHRVDADTIVILADPAKPKGERKSRKIFSFRLSRLGKTEGFERTAIRLHRISSMETRIDVMTELDFDMPVGRATAKNELKRELGGYEAMSSYFLNQFGVEQIYERDGITLGKLIYEGGRDVIKETINNCGALNSLQVKFPWFEAMMEEVLRNKLQLGISQSETKAECLSIAEARKIGKSLATSIAVNITAAGGVDE